MRILAHDYETTGKDPRTCGVVQSAIAIVDMDIRGNWEIVAQEVTLHHPGCPIPAGASKIHGIYDKDVADLPDYEISLSTTMAQAIEEFEPAGVLGYNSIRYDDVIAGRFGLPSDLVKVDMMVAAQRLMTDGHLTRARLVDAYEQLVGKPAENAHDALADVIMTLELVKPVMRIKGFESLPDLVSWLGRPAASRKMAMPFGKHKGMPLDTLPRGYLRWLSRQGDLNRDLEASIQEVLNANVD